MDNIARLKVYFQYLPTVIKCLEFASLPLKDAIDIISMVQMSMMEIPDSVSTACTIKLQNHSSEKSQVPVSNDEESMCHYPGGEDRR